MNAILSKTGDLPLAILNLAPGIASDKHGQG